MSHPLTDTIKQRFRQYRAYRVAAGLKKCLRQGIREAGNFEQKVVSLQPEAALKGKVLLSYRIEPFLIKSGQELPRSHTHFWESREIAHTFLDLGYSVDVIDYRNVHYTTSLDEYSFVIDARTNLERMAPFLDKDCIKIMHIDTAHMLYQNAAESRRLLEIQQRRGVTLRPRRHEMPNLAIEHADCGVILGNAFTIDTFRYANKPLYRVPISTAQLYPWPEDKSFDACRKNFMWFGSYGMVHKGLDLVLEAFADMPELNLTVCGPVQREKDFENAYYKELYETPNINTVGWIDIESKEFARILSESIGIVYPSCSEGGGGSVITCMHAGLIPIVSHEASIDVNSDIGLSLENSNIDEIKRSVSMVASLTESELRNMASNSWQFVRANHTRDHFSQVYRQVINTIMGTHGAG